MTVVSLGMAYRSFQEVLAGLTPASIRRLHSPAVTTQVGAPRYFELGALHGKSRRPMFLRTALSGRAPVCTTPFRSRKQGRRLGRLFMKFRVAFDPGNRAAIEFQHKQADGR